MFEFEARFRLAFESATKIEYSGRNINLYLPDDFDLSVLQAAREHVIPLRRGYLLVISLPYVLNQLFAMNDIRIRSPVEYAGKIKHGSPLMYTKLF